MTVSGPVNKPRLYVLDIGKVIIDGGNQPAISFADAAARDNVVGYDSAGSNMYGFGEWIDGGNQVPINPLSSFTGGGDTGLHGAERNYVRPPICDGVYHQPWPEYG